MEKDTKTTKPVKNTNVSFSPEQMDYIQNLIAQSKEPNNERGQAISMFSNIRNPKEIMSVPMYRFDGKWMIGYKNLNKDPYRKMPKYYELKFDLNRKLSDQPYVTLLLSEDGKEITEKEVLVLDYINNRTRVNIEKGNFSIIEKDLISDHGILGRSNGTFADDYSSPTQMATPVKIKMETKTIVRTFIINVPGFEQPVEMIGEFLA